MLSGGDELGRTQRGNNNAYCQDNETSWYAWNLTPGRQEFLRFVQRLIALRKQHPVLRRRKFFQGRHLRGSAIKDLSWFSPDGREMTDDEWSAESVRSLGVRLAGDAIDETDAEGRPIRGDTLLILLNAHHEPVPFVLPAQTPDTRWVLILDTAMESPERRKEPAKGGHRYQLQERSLALFQLVTQDERS
jgi:glycogen operon protein